MMMMMRIVYILYLEDAENDTDAFDILKFNAP